MTVAQVHLELRGANAAAFESRERECLLAAAAGSGKSVALLYKCLTLLTKYPGCRGLFCRDTRASLTQSGLVTWEGILEGAGFEDVARASSRRVRQSYEFPNGSEFVVAGLDNPGKTLSSEYDFCYIMEATEGVEFATYETLLRSLRHGKMVKDGLPWHQIMMDCNPTTPTHWLYRRQASGLMRMYSGSHKDNPLYWDTATNDYTPQGREYIEGVLAVMSGARRARFYEGIWKAATGLVYDNYNPAVHNHPVGWLPPRHWPRVWGIDWGYTNPTALGMAAIDPDDGLHWYKEYYATRTRSEDLAKWAKRQVEEFGEPIPLNVLCDHDPEAVATFKLYGPGGIGLEMAEKTDKTGGIEMMQGMFDVQEDGKPRIYFTEGARVNPMDHELVGAGKPTCGLEEVIGYSWDVSNPDRLKDEPVKMNDHFCLVAGTLIETRDGEKPIEDVQVGEWVLTRKGYRRVTVSMMTSDSTSVFDVLFSDGRVLTGTGNHPVWVEGVGFVDIDALRYSDTVIAYRGVSQCRKILPFTNSNQRNRLSGCDSEGSFTVDIRAGRHLRTATITERVSVTSTVVERTSIETFGRLTTDRSRTASKSITRTGTHSTTQSAISSCSISVRTKPSTLQRSVSDRWTGGTVRPKRKRNLNSTSWPFGTPPQKGENGTALMPSGSWEKCRSLNQRVSTVANSFRSALRPRTEPNSVTSIAEQRRAESVATITKFVHAGGAGKDSRLTGTLGSRTVPRVASGNQKPGRVYTALRHSDAPRASQLNTVPLHVLEVRERTQRVPVFNLTVEDAHEYFANGILVSNCDLARYVCRWVHKYTQKPAPRTPQYRRPADPFGRLPRNTWNT